MSGASGLTPIEDYLDELLRRTHATRARLAGCWTRRTIISRLPPRSSRPRVAPGSRPSVRQCAVSDPLLT